MKKRKSKGDEKHCTFAGVQTVVFLQMFAQTGKPNPKSFDSILLGYPWSLGATDGR